MIRAISPCFQYNNHTRVAMCQLAVLTQRKQNASTFKKKLTVINWN
jgi:hypothetical protein